jgi:cell division protein FtsW (lipid II flippase)
MSRGQALVFIYITTAVVALGAVPLRTVGRAGALALLAQTVLIFWILYRIERTVSRKD